MLDAEAYIIDKTPFITAGHYYVVNAVGASTAKNATLNGIQDWQIGDWVIASTTNVWQKLNNSSVEGSGTENRLPKWTAAVSTLIDSSIIDNGTTIKLENDTELGAVAGDAIKSVGVLTADEQLILKKGLGLGGATYGDAGQVLTSAGAAADVPTWEDPTTGTVTEVDSGIGLVTTPTAGITATGSIAIKYLGADNAILATTAATEPILTTDQIWFNDVATLEPATPNKIKNAPTGSLPFNDYFWKFNAGNVATASINADPAGLEVTNDTVVGTIEIGSLITGTGVTADTKVATLVSATQITSNGAIGAGD